MRRSARRSSSVVSRSCHSTIGTSARSRFCSRVCSMDRAAAPTVRDLASVRDRTVFRSRASVSRLSPTGSVRPTSTRRSTEWWRRRHVSIRFRSARRSRQLPNLRFSPAATRPSMVSTPARRRSSSRGRAVMISTVRPSSSFVMMSSMRRTTSRTTSTRRERLVQRRTACVRTIMVEC